MSRLTSLSSELKSPLVILELLNRLTPSSIVKPDESSIVHPKRSALPSMSSLTTPYKHTVQPFDLFVLKAVHIERIPTLSLVCRRTLYALRSELSPSTATSRCGVTYSPCS
jgi:hypothetical protein